MFRKIVIYSNTKINEKGKLKIPKDIKKALSIRQTKIITKIINNSNSNSKSNSKSKTYSTPRIELYGYDKTLKYTSKNISTKTLKNIISKIDNMPMGEIEKHSRNSSLEN